MDWLTRLRERFFVPRDCAASYVPGEHAQLECFQRFHEPFFRNRKDAESYVIREVAQAVPERWAVRRLSDEHLRWSIEKQQLEPNEWPNQDYGVWISSGLDVVILTHGNNDVGTFGLHHALRSAIVIEAGYLRAFRLGECLGFLFAHYAPNQSSST